MTEIKKFDFDKWFENYKDKQPDYVLSNQQIVVAKMGEVADAAHAFYSEQLQQLNDILEKHIRNGERLLHENLYLKHNLNIDKLKSLLREAVEITQAQQDLNVAYRIGKRPKEKSLDILNKFNVSEFIEKAKGVLK